ncbi:MAG: hypothetical protein NTY80_04715 [candidate division SR1 bacterium]|nr:hypothetical protein [candidate division SR1 bacterium]
MQLKEQIFVSQEESTATLQKILNQYADRLVVVVATSCSGKTTFLKSIKNAYDMDELFFPFLIKEQADYVCQDPRTPQIGNIMNKRVKEKIKVSLGKPVFGTVVLDSDIIVYIKVDDALLKERSLMRNAKFENIKNMQKHIEEDIQLSTAEVIELIVTK